MESKHAELGIFLFQLIDVQIKKYLKLTEAGIGPDAGMNADLVRGEVEELMSIAQEFMLRLEQKTMTDEILERYISHMQFYLELEEQRAIAGELLDSNNIHNSVFDRLQKQIPELDRYVQKYGLNPPPFQASTRQQQQCKFDTYAISDFILHSALLLRINSKATLPQGLSPYPQDLLRHAESIMRRNARLGRYSNPDILKQLETGHRYFQAHLKQSTLQKSTQILSNAHAKKTSQIHQRRLEGLLSRFNHLKPTKCSSSIEWYTIPHLRRNLPNNRPIPQFKFKEPARAPKNASSLCSCSMFKAATAVAVGVGATAIAGLVMAYR